MLQSEAFNTELRAIFQARVIDSFKRARHCLQLARMAHREGDSVELKKWLWCVNVLRVAAAGWRDRARAIAPLFVCVLLMSCAAAEETMTLTITGDEQGTIEWQLAMPEGVWRHLGPAQTDLRTFDFDRQASVMLTSLIDDELARKHLCPHRWTFGPGFRLKTGTWVFTGQCDRRLVQG